MRVLTSHWLTVVTAAAGVLSLVLLAAARPSVSDGQGPRAPAVPARSAVPPAGRSARAAPTPVAARRACQPGSRATGYVNPLATATVTPKRIDQGVDYAGSGTLSAIGNGVITQVALSGTGWPGAFIAYRLRSGPEAGCDVFYAEGVTPVPGLHVGEPLSAGQAVAVIDPQNPAGIEIGWGSGEGTQTYAGKLGQWSAQAEDENIPTGPGMSFSALVAATGGPAGRVLSKAGTG